MITLVVVLACALLLVPIIALVQASSAINEARQARTAVKVLEKEVYALRRSLEQVRVGESSFQDSPAQKMDEAVHLSTVAQSSTTSLQTGASAPEFPLELGKDALVSGKMAAEEAANESAPSDEPPRLPPKHYVFTDENRALLSNFIRAYWLYILGSLTLALSGIYLVRWGIENGYVPPVLRVFFAVVLGLGLLYVAERFRQKWGDEKESALEYMPSSIAAAGVATLYAAAFGAYILYGLIAPLTAFIALMAIALMAIVAGLRFGLLLSALGVLGAYLAPFIIGGGGGREYLLFGYSLLILVTALVVDSFRRSAWLSVFALITALTFSFFIYLRAAHLIVYNLGFVLFGLAFFVSAVVIPGQKILPDYAGAGLWDWTRGRGKGQFPEFPTRLAALGMMGALLIAVISYIGNWQQFFWLEVWYFFTIALLSFAWFLRAGALQDLALLPMAACLLLVFINSQTHFLINSLINQDRFTVLVCISLILGACSAAASFVYQRHRLIYSFVAIAYPLAIALILQFLWNEAPFASQSAGLTWLLLAYGVAVAAIYAHRHGLNALPTEAAVMGCFISLALLAFRLFTGDAHIAAYFVLTAAAIFLAYRFTWKYLKILGQGFSVIVALLITGKVYALFRHPDNILQIWVPVLTLAGFYCLCRLARKESDAKLNIHFEGYILALGAAVLVILARYCADFFHIDLDYLRLSWLGMLFFAMSVGMEYRMRQDDRFNAVRRPFFIGYLGLAILYVVYAAIFLNPLWRNGLFVSGYPFFNSVLFAYAPIIGAIYYAWRFMDIPQKTVLNLDRWMYGVSAALFLELNRQFWQGANMYIGRPNSMGETVSYTVILLVAVGVSMWLTITKRSRILRSLAVGLLLATAVKVYFIDLTHTAGITRVLVLFIFGAILLGFNFLDRKLSHS